MTDTEKQEVPAGPLEAFREVNQKLVESLTAAQERNLKYAQSVFDSTIALLKSHLESTQAQMEQWEQQAHAQQGGAGGTESYLSLFRAPLTLYQQALDAMESTAKESMETFEKATQDWRKAVEQGRERWLEAMQQASGQSQH